MECSARTLLKVPGLAHENVLCSKKVTCIARHQTDCVTDLEVKAQLLVHTDLRAADKEAPHLEEPRMLMSSDG